MRCAVTHLDSGIFCVYRAVKFEMQTEHSGIHTSLVTIRRGKTIHYDVSPNDKKTALNVAGVWRALPA